MLGDWNTWYPGRGPLAHDLRLAFPDRWVRFHSLPGSKRYPDGAAEYSVVLERHNRILGELAHQEEGVVLLTTGYSRTPEPVRPQAELVELDLLASPWRTVAVHEQEGDFGNPNYWHVFGSQWRWSPGVFDPIVRLVADDMLANIMVVALDCRWLLHPYDGGMDVISESTRHRDEMKAKYQDWLSHREDGL
jgi:hypothetical protein